VEKLTKEWALRNEDSHPKARRFVYDEWVNVKSPDELRTHIPTAKAALQTFIEVNDRLSPLMLQRANINHARMLEKRQSELERSKQAEDEKELQSIVELAPELLALTNDTLVFLKGKASDP
jgi:hypothetical protein